jgi:outer membrane receptor protein involved in Fe transport
MTLTGAHRGRFPALKERYTSGALGTKVPNPGLQPETSWNLGADAAWRPVRGVSILAGAFDSKVSGQIENVPVGGGMEQLQNISGARLMGAEARVSASPWPPLGLDAGYAYLHARAFDRPPAARPEYESDRLEYRPAHRMRLAAAYRPLRWLRFSGDVTVTGPEDFQNKDTLRWGELGWSAVSGLRADLRPERGVDIWVQATNLLDAFVQSEYGYPEPGREVWIGVRLTYEQPNEPDPD